MLYKLPLLAIIIPASLASCRPKPIEIDIPQQAGTMVISSACPNANTVYISASYSVNSLFDLLDTTDLRRGQVISKSLLIDTAIVTLRNDAGGIDTLRKIADGLWGKNGLQLQPGMQYQLSVLDCRKGKLATATATFLPQLQADTLYSERISTSADTLVKLHLRVNDVAANSYFFVSYTTLRDARANSIPLPFNNKAMNFAPKQVALYSSNDATRGTLEQTITLQALAGDTLMVQVAQVDKASYDYLAAYKRTGSFINQLTGEPINLPGNVSGALGLFALYQPVYRVYDLKKL